MRNAIDSMNHTSMISHPLKYINYMRKWSFLTHNIFFFEKTATKEFLKGGLGSPKSLSSVLGHSSVLLFQCFQVLNWFVEIEIEKVEYAILE